MSTHPSDYCRPAPPAYTELVDLTDDEITRAGLTAFTPGLIATVWDAACTIKDNEVVDDARYQGLGRVMLEFKGLLGQPGDRKRDVEYAALCLAHDRFATEGRWSPRGLLVSDIFIGASPFDHKAQKAANALPLSEHVVADVLTAEAQRRSLILKHPDSIRLLSRGLTSRSYREASYEDLMRGHSTAREVSGTATAAAESVLQIVLMKRYEARCGRRFPTYEEVHCEGDDAQFPTVAEALNGATLDALDWETVALRCAAQRQDEFVTRLRDFIRIDEKGQAVFDKTGVVPSKFLPAGAFIDRGDGKEPTPPLHNRRLRCPAIFVSGLIPTIVDFTNETVTAAQALAADALEARRRRGW